MPQLSSCSQGRGRTQNNSLPKSVEGDERKAAGNETQYWETIGRADVQGSFQTDYLAGRCLFSRLWPPFPTSFLAIRVNSIVVLRNFRHHNINKTYRKCKEKL